MHLIPRLHGLGMKLGEIIVDRCGLTKILASQLPKQLLLHVMSSYGEPVY